MMATEAETPEAYIAAVEEARRPLAAHLRQLVRENLADGFVETCAGGMICYAVPLALSGPTYNGKPLMYAGIAAMKGHVALHLMGLYCDAAQKARFAAAYSEAGVRLDMGKSCLRVKRTEDVLDPAIAEAVSAHTPAAFIAMSPKPRRGKT